ncbi:hypothetical protein CR513_48662, partial [Mucuna pruriens]
MYSPFYKYKKQWSVIVLSDVQDDGAGMFKPQMLPTTSKRLADRKVARFQRNSTKKGSENSKKGYAYPVGPIVLGFFVFVVVGSFKLKIG